MRKRHIAMALVPTLAAASVACEDEHVEQTRADLYVMAQAVAVLHARDNVCPQSIGDLVEAGILRPTALVTDDWGGELRLSCDPPAYRASSAGPDRSFGTDDDIVATQILEAKAREFIRAEKAPSGTGADIAPSRTGKLD